MTLVQYDRTNTPARSRSSMFNAEWLLDPAEIAQRIGGTDFVPKALRNNPAAITAALLYGAEVGLGPMQSLAKIHVLDGRPSMAAEAQRALILGAGHELVVEESTNTRCTIAGRRRDSDALSRVTWTLDDAKRAKIAGRPAWQAYPRAMLLARASAELARAIFADVIGGIAATEEVDDVDAELELEPVEAPKAAKPPASRRRKRTAVTAGSSGPSSAPPTPEPPPAADDPTPEPGQPDTPAAPDMPNQAQLNLMFALMNEKGITDRAAMHAYAEQTVGRPVATSKELTALDVSRIIEALKAEPDAALPANEQAVVDELAARLDATPDEPAQTEHPDPPADEPDRQQPLEYGEFPEGY